ncbi:MAG: 2-dehydro-3-deoxygalactonokinase [Alphaproteobacteria bacterium]|nr:2-dehydro-3-deoxygalactonokinase [Alphaproteobacteria bacterium]
MRWAEGFIAVDWGTTNRRGYRLGPSGRLEDRMEDDKGVLSVAAGGFPAAIARIRERLGDLPLLLAGMIGSNRGWREAPYAPAPAGLEELAERLVWVEPGRAAIVPGISWTAGDAADVMRGEEIQILGALADGMVGEEERICHPGTHNKWIRVEKGRIASFRTVMTGELFSLLKEHSILADLLAGPIEPGPAFEAGVRHGRAHDDLTAELFSIRARVLLGKAKSEDAAAYASGLLIGYDLKTGLDGPGDVAVIGRPDLTRLFAAAIRSCGRRAREIDGEAAFLAGARHLAEPMR